MNSDDQLTFSKRAKEWHGTPFTVRWIDNTVKALTVSPGKEQFERWVVDKYRPQAGVAVITACNRRVPRSSKTPTPTAPVKTLVERNTFMFRAAAAHYGVTSDGIRMWHEYASEMNLFQPERTGNPPRRGKETSGMWMALLDGHKLPIIDLDYSRRTAIAEFDKARDALERWRTDPKLFWDDIFTRSKSIIPSPEILGMDPRIRQRVAIDDAFRTRLYFLQKSHMAWKAAAELFEELAARGLNTPAAIERAYQREPALVWRFVAVIERNSALTRKMWANFQQLLAASKYYGPLLKPSRGTDGIARITSNNVAIQALGKTFTPMDDIVVQTAISLTPSPVGFFQRVEDSIDKKEREKFSAEEFEAMGDIAAANEFNSQFMRTEFGMRLFSHAARLEKDPSTDRALMLSTVCFIDPAKLSPSPPAYWDRVGEASRCARAQNLTWSETMWQKSIEELLIFFQNVAGPMALASSDNVAPLMPVEMFNDIWKKLDEAMWDSAAALDRRGEQGRVAREYGLWNPSDRNRPKATRHLFWELEMQATRGDPVQPKTTPAAVPQVYEQTIPVSQTTAQSGHAFASSKEVTKAKVKTRGDAAPTPVEVEVAAEEEPVVLPQRLPSEFKLGKKTLKLFHRVLEPPEDDEKDDAPTKGQVKWGDFETAMKRIGFEIVQTAGSSVRFEPPAATARPITFHRPHPDAILSPHAIKWLGARLKRTYGWTTATFQRVEGE
ncbi:hypothetical protein HMN09_00801700 [Mycena chlorophos]|uniref:Type II toxin-antitoxin system HicA family toxin n=1 Tax=Mycena chlorophos TaxID=658473 RepID=A0A8H6W4K6_MYCCL|nr:hypothetical protein HMN09_00801700 [Mycena chlorophos]